MSYTNLQFPAAPNLPLAPQEWNTRYQDQFANILRLYFNQLSGLLQQLGNTQGAYRLSFPYGVFYDTTTQTVASTTTAYVIKFNTTDYTNGIKVVDNSKLTVDRIGLYNLQFSIQLANDDNQPQDVDIWLRKNGLDVANSNTRFGLSAHKSAGNPYHTVAALNLVSELNQDDYLELVWSATDTAVTIQNYAAGSSPTRPAVPSTIATMTFVSAPVE